MGRDRALTFLLLPAGLCACVLLAFHPVTDARFVNWDDPLVVTENHRFRGLDTGALAWMVTTSHAGHYQPLTWLSLALDEQRLGLTAPDFPEAAGFHRSNLLLHAAGTVALYFLALALLGRTSLARAGPTRLALAAAFAALFHGLHPLRCESVCWVTERRDVLSGLFFVLAVWAWLRAASAEAVRARPVPLAVGGLAAALGLALALASLSTAGAQLTWAGPGAAGLAAGAAALALSVAAAARGFGGRGSWFALSFGALVLSLLAKAWGIVLPAVLVVIDLWPLRRAHLRQPRSLGLLLLEKAPFVAVALLFARLAAWAQTAQQGDIDVWSDHGPGERLVQALYGLAFYPARTLLPLDLVPLYNLPDQVRLLEPRFLIAALAAVGITALLLGTARRFPAGLAAWAAYAVIVSPVLGVLQSGPQLVADRYSYLSCIPFALLAGGALAALTRHGGPRARAAWAVAVAVLVLLGALTWRQSAVWQSSETLWTHAREHGSRAPLALLNLGLVRADAARRQTDPAERERLEEEALALFREGRALQPGSDLFAINTAIVLADRARRQSDEARAATLERALALAEEAVAAGAAKGIPDAAVHWHHGRILLQAGRLEPAIDAFEQAAALRPRWPAARMALGAALLERARRTGETDPREGLAQLGRARDELEAALAVDPETQRVRFLLAGVDDVAWQLLTFLDQPEAAARARRGALRGYAAVAPGDPAHERARRRLAELAGPP